MSFPRSQTLFGNAIVNATPLLNPRRSAIELPQQVRSQIEFGNEGRYNLLQPQRGEPTPAQGNALGKYFGKSKPCKGASSVQDYATLSGLMLWSRLCPGRCPGLS